ncbi:hypothetical protein I4U23_016506 [Adineta vaga]|nr:hypothetical protein I4U23_016506 [Adineta vaga]
MFFVIIIISANAVTQSAPGYMNLNDLINKELSLTTPSVESIVNKYKHINEIKNSINQATDYVRILLPPFLVFCSVLCTIIYFYFRKCFYNNCRCKPSWFRPKSLNEYQRRQDIKRRRQIALDQLVNQSTPIYSIA